MSLFQLSKIILHSRKTSWIKIECDALSPKTKEDWEALAYAGSRIVGPFSEVVGVPRGGVPFARAMRKYAWFPYSSAPILIVDDVLTTGGSLLKEMAGCLNSIGLVAFARGPCPPGVKAIFQMHPDAEDAE